MNEALFQSHVVYMLWADKVIMDAASKMDAASVAKDAGSSHGGILGTLHHMYRAEYVWIERVLGNSARQVSDFQPPADLQELATDWEALHKRWESLASERQDWNHAVTYANSTGQTFTVPLAHIVLHVVNHSTLHRGQAVAMMRQAGFAPPNTDLILFYRTQAAAVA